MNYKDLWDIWLESKKQNTPEGFSDVKDKEGTPKNYFLTPEDMTILGNAFTPYDLYMQPNTYPLNTPYATSAFNIKTDKERLGVPNAIAQSNQEPQGLSNLISTQEASKNYPEYLRGQVPQAIYEHEVAHSQDPRLFYGNKGNFIPMTQTIGGVQQKPVASTGFIEKDPYLWSKELPAMNAEDTFWERLIGGLKEKRKLLSIIVIFFLCGCSTFYSNNINRTSNGNGFEKTDYYQNLLFNEDGSRKFNGKWGNNDRTGT